MSTKTFCIALILFIGFCSIYGTCKKGVLGCANTVYSFRINETIFPDRDSIRVGDTIYLNVNASTKLIDLQRNDTVQYDNTSNLGNVVTILKFLPDNKDGGAIQNFNLIVIKGTKVETIHPLSQQEVGFVEENGNYKFKMAIVAKDTGRYVITISNAANVYRKNDYCTKASFTINIDSTNQHFYLLNLWSPSDTLDEEGKKRVYYFKVY